MSAGDIDIRTPELEFRAPMGELADLFKDAPNTTYFHVRDTLGAIMGSHRREWLRRTQVDVGQPGSRGLRALNLSTRQQVATGFAAERSFFYTVTPANKRRTEGQSLETLKGEAYTPSDVALGQEQGGTFRSKRGRFLAIPIGIALRSDGSPIPRWRTPRLFKRGKKEKELVAIPLKGRSRSAGPFILYWRKPIRGRGRPKKGEARKHAMLPAFLLVPRIHLQPRLRFLRTWDELAGDRDRRFALSLQRIVEDMAKGRRA